MLRDRRRLLELLLTLLLTLVGACGGGSTFDCTTTGCKKGEECLIPEGGGPAICGPERKPPVKAVEEMPK